MGLFGNITKTASAILAAAILTAVAAQSTAPRSPIRLNSVGFLPDFPKVATILAPDGCEAECEGMAFSVKTSPGNNEAYSGVTSVARGNAETNEILFIADFSELTEPGSYYLDVSGVGTSPVFSIARDVFTEPYRAMMLGMYLWRCGMPSGVDATYRGVRYNHGACHLNDASIRYINNAGQDSRRDASGGWHDAGDYNKYVVNSGVTVGLMLKAWEHFSGSLGEIDLMAVPADGNLPKFLAEVKWNLDWVAKMQYAYTDQVKNGRVSHKISTLGFGGNMMPEDERTTRYFVPWGTAATGAFVAMLAQASRIYRPYNEALADKWLAQARLSYDVLAANERVAANQAGFSTGAYESGRDSDQRAWAAAEMWETTGEERFLNDLEERFGSMGEIVRAGTEWANVQNLASLTYLSSNRPGRDPERVETLTDQLFSVADGIVNTANSNGYGRTSRVSYYWGANGTVASTAHVLYGAYRLRGDPKYLHAVQNAVSHLLGRNYYGRSFVTGVGHNPPVYPHCRRSATSGYRLTWPGYLIGGPHNKRNHNDAPENLKCDLHAVCWFDEEADYWTNEIAINWNSAMIYALSALIAAPEQSSVRHTQTSPRAQSGAAGARVSRAVRFQNGRINIPPGARVYSLDGRLVARRGLNDSNMPILRRNGVYIIKIDNVQHINNNGSR